MSPRPARWRPSPDDLRGLLLPVTAASCCWAARIERAAALVPPVGHPTSHHVTGHKQKPAHRNKSGRPRARTTQVTHCVRAPPAGAAAHGPMATAGSQAKSQLREGRRRWSTAVSQSCPERRASSCQTRSAFPCQAPYRLAAPVPGASALRPACQLPSGGAPVAGHYRGASPPDPRARGKSPERS